MSVAGVEEALKRRNCCLVIAGHRLTLAAAGFTETEVMGYELVYILEAGDRRKSKWYCPLCILVRC